MYHTLRNILPIFALAAAVGTANAAEVTYPRLRAALHELREARASLKDATDTWPRGYRERALASINDAIEDVRVILEVKSVDSFRGVDRSADFYKKFDNHPRLRAALADLRDARSELAAAKGDFRGKKAEAIDHIDVAIGDILTLIRYKKR